MVVRTEKISTGSYDLNKWLYGGYETDVVTMIAGPAASGKTNFCILVACSQAKKGNKVIFVDTEGGFSVERVRQMVPDNYEEVLKNILLLSPSSFEEEQESFSQLMKKINKEDIGVIIVDGMATLYRLELGEAVRSGNESKIREINGKLAQQMKMLSEIARKQHIPVIITNQVYTGFLSEEELKQGVKKETNLVGGDLMKYWCKCIIELKLEGRRKAVLLKHRNMPQKEINFEIDNSGIFKKGWI